MAETTILKSGIILVEDEHKIKVSNRGVIDSDQVDLAKTKVGIRPRSLGNH